MSSEIDTKTIGSLTYCEVCYDHVKNNFDSINPVTTTTDLIAIDKKTVKETLAHFVAVNSSDFRY